MRANAGSATLPETSLDVGVAVPAEPFIDLYWLPLGAGGHFVRLNGRVYEAVVSRIERRPTCDLYHSALAIGLPHTVHVIESAPIRPNDGLDRGVVGEGPVGMRWAAHFRLFRYELRVWRGGYIPDIAGAVEGPRRLSWSARGARRLPDVA